MNATPLPSRRFRGGGMNTFFIDSPSHSMKSFNDGGGYSFSQVFTNQT